MTNMIRSEGPTFRVLHIFKDNLNLGRYGKLKETRWYYIWDAIVEDKVGQKYFCSLYGDPNVINNYYLNKVTDEQAQNLIDDFERYEKEYEMQIHKSNWYNYDHPKEDDNCMDCELFFGEW